MPYRPSRVSQGVPYLTWDASSPHDVRPDIVADAQFASSQTEPTDIDDKLNVWVDHLGVSSNKNWQFFISDFDSAVKGSHYSIGIALQKASENRYLEVDLELHGTTPLLTWVPFIGRLKKGQTLAAQGIKVLDRFCFLSSQGLLYGQASHRATMIIKSTDLTPILGWSAFCRANIQTDEDIVGRISYREYSEDLDVYDPNR